LHMAKGGKEKKAGGKEERRARKAAANREREGRKIKRGAPLDRSQVVSFVAALKAAGFALFEVARDGNCFYRSIADQFGDDQSEHDSFRQRIVTYMEEHADDYTPFLTFGEGDEEEDEDYPSYLARMRREGEWAGQPELLAASQALQVDIVIHQYEAPTYRIECSSCGKGPSKGSACIHLSYHDGEHYNSVRSLTSSNAATGGRQWGGSVAASHRRSLIEAEQDEQDEDAQGDGGASLGSLSLTDGGDGRGDEDGGGSVPKHCTTAVVTEDRGNPSNAPSRTTKKRAEKQARAAQRHREAALASKLADADADASDTECQGGEDVGQRIITL